MRQGILHADNLTLHEPTSCVTSDHAMRGFLHLLERDESPVVTLAHFLERPAHAHITRQSFAAIGRPFKSGDGGVIGTLLVSA